MCDAQEIWRFEAKWIAKTNEHAKLRFDSINRTDEVCNSSVPFKLDKIVLKEVKANNNNIIFSFEFKKNVFVGRTIVHYVSICVPNLPDGWNIPFLISTLHDDNSVFKNILNLADAWILGIKACSPQCNLQLVCSKEHLGEATCFISFSVCKDHKNWESAKDELIAVAASALKFDPTLTSPNASADDCNKTKTNMNAAATISKNMSETMGYIWCCEFDWNSKSQLSIKPWIEQPLEDDYEDLSSNKIADVTFLKSVKRKSSTETLVYFFEFRNQFPLNKVGVFAIIRKCIDVLPTEWKIHGILDNTQNLENISKVLTSWLCETAAEYKPGCTLRLKVSRENIGCWNCCIGLFVSDEIKTWIELLDKTITRFSEVFNIPSNQWLRISLDTIDASSENGKVIQNNPEQMLTIKDIVTVSSDIKVFITSFNLKWTNGDYFRNPIVTWHKDEEWNFTNCNVYTILDVLRTLIENETCEKLAWVLNSEKCNFVDAVTSGFLAARSFHQETHLEKCLSYITLVIEQWMKTVDAVLNPSMELALVISDEELELKCKCHVSKLNNPDIQTKRLEINKKIMKFLVMASAKMDSKLPNVLYVVEKLLEFHGIRDYETYIIPQIINIAGEYTNYTSIN